MGCGGTGTSDFARNDLLVEEILPDATDHVFHAYNRQGERKQTADQKGTVHVFDRDRLGRGTADNVMAFGAEVDDRVAAIARSYDHRGLLEHVQSLDGSDVVLNDVQFAYNDFMQPATEYQEHAGEVDTGTSPKVEYAYAAGSDDGGVTNNTIRRTGVTYPTARVTPPTLEYNFGTAGGINDKLSRIEQVDFAGTSGVVQYAYLGLNGVVKASYSEPGVQYTLESGNEPGRYGGLDQFDRVVDCLWQTTGETPTALARLKYGYDLASNRTYRRDEVARTAGKKFDELYTYDQLNRLKSAGRGELSEDNSRLEPSTFAQAWQLDPTGNWSRFSEFDNQGESFTSLDQHRTSNAANEISAINVVSGPVWKQPEYDRAGNMTTIPKPKDPPSGFIGIYDAWNRLLRLRDIATAAIAQESQYDGLTRRIATFETSGVTWDTLTIEQWEALTLGEWLTMEVSPVERHFYYSDSWQVLEERTTTTDDPPALDRQFVWGLRYIDDEVLRDRSVSGTLDQRMYAIQDANWNMAAICDVEGEIQERYAYTPYGVPLFLAPDFTLLSASAFGWDTLFCGYRYDAITSLYLVRFRPLHPVIGSWMKPDPLFNSFDSVRFSYGILSPIQATDPFGLEPRGTIDFKVTSLPMPADKREDAKNWGLLNHDLTVTWVPDSTLTNSATCACNEVTLYQTVRTKMTTIHAFQYIHGLYYEDASPAFQWEWHDDSEALRKLKSITGWISSPGSDYARIKDTPGWDDKISLNIFMQRQDFETCAVCVDRKSAELGEVYGCVQFTLIGSIWNRQKGYSLWGPYWDKVVVSKNDIGIGGKDFLEGRGKAGIAPSSFWFEVMKGQGHRFQWYRRLGPGPFLNAAPSDVWPSKR